MKNVLLSVQTLKLHLLMAFRVFSLLHTGALLCLLVSGCSENKNTQKKDIHTEGGVILTVEVAVGDQLTHLTGALEKTTVSEAVRKAYTLTAQDTSLHFIDAFYRAYQDSEAHTRLSVVFHPGDKERFRLGLTDQEVLEELKKEQRQLLDRVREILRTRLAKAGVRDVEFKPGPNWHSMEVVLPGLRAEDLQGLRKLITSRTWIEFQELYTMQEAFPLLIAANARYQELSLSDTAATNEDEPSLFELFLPLKQNARGELDWEQQAHVASCRIADTAAVNRFLYNPSLSDIWPNELQWCWSAKSEDDVMSLYAVKVNTIRSEAPVNGSHIFQSVARQSPNGNYEIYLTLNSEGAEQWTALTRKNKGQHLAVIIDNQVHIAPKVLEAITEGELVISGNFSRDEATDLAMMLEIGALPVRVALLNETYVAPSSQGKESN